MLEQLHTLQGKYKEFYFFSSFQFQVIKFVHLVKIENIIEKLEAWRRRLAVSLNRAKSSMASTASANPVSSTRTSAIVAPDIFW